MIDALSSSAAYAPDDRPSALSRAAFTLLYLLFAPAAYLFGLQRRSPFRAHHLRHALASRFLFHSLLIAFIVLGVLGSLLGMHHEELYFALHLDAAQSILFFALLGALVLLTVLSGVHALRGRTTAVPLLTRLAGRPWLPAVSVAQSALFTLVMALAAALAAHSASITPSRGDTARVYMLYDDLDAYPRWIFTLGFLPITAKATAALGPDSVCVCKLTPETFRQAFGRGKFIVLATHGGGAGKVYADGRWYTARNALEARRANRPSFLYITACSLGKGDDSWNRAFPETEIVSFDRWSAVLEHAWWMYTDGPDELEARILELAAQPEEPLLVSFEEQLARAHPGDRVAHTEAKSDFIRNVTERAKKVYWYPCPPKPCMPATSSWPCSSTASSTRSTRPSSCWPAWSGAGAAPGLRPSPPLS